MKISFLAPTQKHSILRIAWISKSLSVGMSDFEDKLNDVKIMLLLKDCRHYCRSVLLKQTFPPWHLHYESEREVTGMSMHGT